MTDDKNYYEIQLDNRWLILIFIGIVVLLGLVFIWGMKVGREAAELEQGINDSTRQDVTRSPVEEEDLKSKAYTEPIETDDLTSFDLKTDLVEKKSEKKSAELSTAQKPSTSTQNISSGGAGSTKISTTQIESRPSRNDSTITTGKYVIQILSIQDKQKAEYYVKILKDQGYPAFISSIELANSGLFYRVRVGGFQTQAEAQQAVSKILSDDKLQPLLKGKKNLLITKQF